MTPFQVAVGDDALADLHHRLATARWPEPATVGDWTQGVPLPWLRELCAYWRDVYDWRRCESRLNALDQLTTDIDGLTIHAIHVRSPEADALPLVLTHGWPGSVVEFLDVIGPLTDPVAHGGDATDAFHVVCPSLPGYGFSGKPVATGWGVERIASAWVTLMGELGYERFGAQGGDWGAAVTTALGQHHADRVTGIHLNMATVRPGHDEGELTESEQRTLADFAEHLEWGAGYSLEQATRPQTLGYGLVDSPVGQCAWITEKFWAWTDHDGDPTSALSRDQMLDNVSVYWFTGTAASSARLYWENGFSRPSGRTARAAADRPIEVPACISIFPREIFRPSRRWCERRFTDLRFYEELDRGGHFAAFEQPELFVDQIRRAFRAIR